MPAVAVPGRLLPLRGQDSSPRGDRDLGPYLGGRSKALKCQSVTFGEVDEPADPLRIGEPHLPPAPCSSSASWSDIRFYVAVKSRPARDSLIRRKNSLMARINSLQGGIKYPVPMRGESGRKLLYLGLHSEPIAALGGPDEQNSRYYVASATTLNLAAAPEFTM